MNNLRIQLESFQEPAAVIDFDFHVLDSNLRFKKLVTKEPEKVDELRLPDLFADRSGIERIIPGKIEPVSLKSSGNYLIASTKIGDEADAQILVTFFKNEEEKSAGGNPDKNDTLTLELILAGISHEINNPNSFISLNIPFLKEGFDKIFTILDRFELIKEKFRYNNLDYYEFKSEIYEVLEDMNVGSTRINDLVQEMKSFVLTDSIGGRDIIVLNSFLKSVTRFMKVHTSKKKIDVQIVCPDEITVAASKNYLTRIMTNVIKNSTDAAPANGGRINISVKRQGAAALILEVADNGHGIEPGKLSEIFTPFYTTKSMKDGFGMGLPICKALAEKMNFELIVNSSLNTGTAVTIKIPGEYVK